MNAAASAGDADPSIDLYPAFHVPCGSCGVFWGELLGLLLGLHLHLWPRTRFSFLQKDVGASRIVEMRSGGGWACAGADARLYFRFANLPHPDGSFILAFAAACKS